MRRCFTSFCLIATALLAAPGIVATAECQGTITFDANPNWSGTHYNERAMAFQVILPQGGTYDDMAIGYGAGNTPQNGTPFMVWFRQLNPYDYVSLSLSNGAMFGLNSVHLADPNAPSLSPVSISFVGYLSGGSSVTNTFTTPGNGATTFAMYTFDSAFASGLTSVDILAPRWAMDNLVFSIPEPSVGSIGLLALMAFAARARRAGLISKGPSDSR